MKREELKEKIYEICHYHNDCHDETVDELLSIIDEYTKPKTKKKSLEERKEKFRIDCVHQEGENVDFDLKDFFEYWTEHNEGGQKMRFEMSKNQPFNIKRRLATWKKNQKTFNNGTTTTNKTTGDNLESWVNS